MKFTSIAIALAALILIAGTAFARGGFGYGGRGYGMGYGCAFSGGGYGAAYNGAYNGNNSPGYGRATRWDRSATPEQVRGSYTVRANQCLYYNGNRFQAPQQAQPAPAPQD